MNATNTSIAKSALTPTAGCLEMMSPNPSISEIKAAQLHNGTANPHQGEAAIQTFILNQLNAEVSKDEVMRLAINLNTIQGNPVTSHQIFSMIDELSASLEAGMSDDDLLNRIISEKVKPFIDDLGDPHFFCEGEPYRTPSRYVEALVKHRFYRKFKRLPKQLHVREQFDILEAEARFDSPKVRMFNRVAVLDGAFYYDLCDRRFLKVTPSGWEIVPSFPLFRRYKHQQTQVEPVAGGDPWSLFSFLPIPEEERLLVLVFIISLFIAGIAHPILAVCGDQGSAKSFFCNLIIRLIDPTLTERIIQPKNERDLIQTLRQKFATLLDNISRIDQRTSDILCQVCTGGGISYRQLYTDEGENIAQFRHVVIINSIRLAIVNADLMDRSIIIKLSRIAPEDRKPEQELWSGFDKALPGILGGIFDTIVRAMQIYPTVTIDRLPRLADFAKWGYAIAEALGKSGEEFLEAYSQNVRKQNESVVEKNVLCQSVIGLMEGRRTSLHSVSALHSELKAIVGDDSKDETFPKLAHHLRGNLDTLRTTLLEQGISYQFLGRQKTGVKILLTNASVVDDATASPASPDTPRKTCNLPDSVEGEASAPDVSELPIFDFGEVANV